MMTLVWVETSNSLTTAICRTQASVVQESATIIIFNFRHIQELDNSLIIAQQWGIYVDTLTMDQPHIRFCTQYAFIYSSEEEIDEYHTRRGYLND